MKVLSRIMLAAALAVATAFAVQPAKAQFSGCGAGVFGGGTIGSLSGGGSPIGISADGQQVGVTAECGWKFGSLYLGGGAEYGWVYGDLEKLGAKNDLTIFTKAGVVVSNATMLYAHAGWTQISTSGPDLTGWKAGLGSETKLGTTPLYLDLRYTYAVYDESDLGLPPSVDLTSHSFRVGLNLKFGPGMFGGSGPIFSNEDHNTPAGCDPKIDRGCKR